MMRNSNLNSVSTENQHEILMKFGKCLLPRPSLSKYLSKKIAAVNIKYSMQNTIFVLAF